jgi:hypothetical protein
VTRLAPLSHLGGRAGKGPDEGTGEFDFANAMLGFNKEEEMAKLTLVSGNQEGPSPNQETPPPAIEVKKYNKVGAQAGRTREAITAVMRCWGAWW